MNLYLFGNSSYRFGSKTDEQNGENVRSPKTMMTTKVTKEKKNMRILKAA
jgi:hypothetical protein